MGPSPFWAHIGWGNAGPGEDSSKQTLVEARTGCLSLSLSLSLSFAQTDWGEMHRAADRVGWIGNLSSCPISPRWWAHSERNTQRGCREGGDDETLPAIYTPQSTSDQSLDSSGPQSCTDVPVKVWLMLMASPSLVSEPQGQSVPPGQSIQLVVVFSVTADHIWFWFDQCPLIPYGTK